MKARRIPLNERRIRNAIVWDRAMSAEQKLLTDLANYVAFKTQLHTRKGARTGGQKPLADESQTDLWRRARDWLRDSDLPFPESGSLVDG